MHKCPSLLEGEGFPPRAKPLVAKRAMAGRVRGDFLTPLRGLPLTARASRSSSEALAHRNRPRVLSRKGRAGSLLLSSLPFEGGVYWMPAPRFRGDKLRGHDNESRRAEPARHEGGWRAEKRSPIGVRDLARSRRRLSARHTHSSSVCAQVGQRPVAHR
jgi:hypothetical protein